MILVYCVGYFGADPPDASRNAALPLAFAGTMLGPVLADDLLTLHVFWELTSIASFLLVGQSGEQREERRAAGQALLVAVLGGLAMLLGFVLLGAFIKSAELPFDPWLPAAMVAPTPVSAYLHAASMVEAGVYLVARLTPGFADAAVGWAPIAVVGVGTMLLGGWRALRETDLKRVLAFGTVSQLGFLMVLLGTGTPTATLAGIAMLLAHGLFRAPLFLSVGAIDHATGTRDLRRLSGAIVVDFPGPGHRRRDRGPVHRRRRRGEPGAGHPLRPRAGRRGGRTGQPTARGGRGRMNEDWFLPGTGRNHRDPSLLLELTTRVLFPTVLVFSRYLLFVGHYGPGGGFSGGPDRGRPR